jgi:hypothetical protein
VDRGFFAALVNEQTSGAVGVVGGRLGQAKVSSERLGHATVAITPHAYSHVLPSLQRNAADRLDAALRIALIEMSDAG